MTRDARNRHHKKLLACGHVPPHSPRDEQSIYNAYTHMMNVTSFDMLHDALNCLLRRLLAQRACERRIEQPILQNLGHNPVMRV